MPLRYPAISQDLILVGYCPLWARAIVRFGFLPVPEVLHGYGFSDKALQYP